MKSKLKKLTASVMLSSVLLTTAAPSQAYIGVPTIDIGAIAETIAGNIQSAYQWAEEKMIALSQIDMQGLMSKFEIDALNNAIANMIVRVNKATEDVHNKKIIEMTTSDRDVCKNIAINLAMDDVYCSIDEQRSADAKSRATAKAATVAASTSGVEFDKHLSQQIDKMDADCKKLPAGGSSGSIVDTQCSRIENLTQGAIDGDSPANREKTRAASELIIANMTNQQKPRKQTNPTLAESTGKRASTQADLRFDAYKNIALDSMTETNYMKQVPKGNPSAKTPMEALRQFDKEHWGDEKWILEVSNAAPDRVTKPVTTTELLRKIALIDAFNTHLNLLQYEHQLRMERVAASQLDLNLDPMKKTD